MIRLYTFLPNTVSRKAFVVVLILQCDFQTTAQFSDRRKEQVMEDVLNE